MPKAAKRSTGLRGNKPKDAVQAIFDLQVHEIHNKPNKYNECGYLNDLMVEYGRGLPRVVNSNVKAGDLLPAISPCILRLNRCPSWRCCPLTLIVREWATQEWRMGELTKRVWSSRVPLPGCVYSIAASLCLVG